MTDKIDMVIIKKDSVIKKKFTVIDKGGTISFNLNSFTLAVNKNDLKLLL